MFSHCFTFKSFYWIVILYSYELLVGESKVLVVCLFIISLQGMIFKFSLFVVLYRNLVANKCVYY